MSRIWLSLTVELLGGRGTDLWPYPGRIFAVGPSHTFGELADAINHAFARWDLSHLSSFLLADQRMITDAETGSELINAIRGPIPTVLEMGSTRVSGAVALGDEFQFTFDLGDQWVHRCRVGEAKVDPVEVLGGIPEQPMAYFGWGTIPDQYGRTWASDDGSGQPPTRPKQPHPMVVGSWPEQEELQAPDPDALRVAIANRDAEAFLSAVAGRDIDDVLQQIGAGLPMALQQARERAEPVAASVINRLRMRADEGDDVLAQDLLALLRREPLGGRTLPVDLQELNTVLEGDPFENEGGYLDLETGEVYNSLMTDPAMVGEDAAIDVEEEPDRWLWIRCEGSRPGWQDMADFADRQRDAGLQQRLLRAIEGRGAFRRFKDLIIDENLTQQWYAFSDDRRLGRARQFLAGEGIRIGTSED